MKLYRYLLLLLSLNACFSNRSTIQENCHEKIYSVIDSALLCGKDPKNYKSLLFALVQTETIAKQKKGWEILEDPEIISAAKRDYVLLIVDPKQLDISAFPDSKEFQEILKMDSRETRFVVCNRVLYPFREFTLHTPKDQILNELSLGEGP